MVILVIIINNIATFIFFLQIYSKIIADRLVSMIDLYGLFAIFLNVAIYLIILNLIAKFATISKMNWIYFNEK